MTGVSVMKAYKVIGVSVVKTPRVTVVSMVRIVEKSGYLSYSAGDAILLLFVSHCLRDLHLSTQTLHDILV